MITPTRTTAPAPTPRNANEFIEQQLDERARTLCTTFDADVLAFIGNLAFGVDDTFMNVVENMRQKNPGRDKLVVLVTTPGGYIEVVQRTVETLRHHYKIIDFIVPNYAFSAGTVLVMSGDAIYMNYYSRLGPIDPQVNTGTGRQVSAQGYLIQWDRLVKKAQAGTLTTVEAQLMIDGFDQGELYQFEQAAKLSVALLKDWLVQFKFKNWQRTETTKTLVTPAMREARAEAIGNELNDPEKWHSHGYGISMDVLRRDLNLLIDDFDADANMGAQIKDYHGLLFDYLMMRGIMGVLHADGQFVPFAFA